MANSKRFLIAAKMTTLILVILVLSVFAWLLIGSGSNAKQPHSSSDHRTISASRTGFASGAIGQSISDAAVAHYALQQTEQPADIRDLGTAVGMTEAVKQD